MAASNTASGAITSANLHQHLQQQEEQRTLAMQRLESHQLAANYASLAPPVTHWQTSSYPRSNAASSSSYNNNGSHHRLSFSSTDSDSRGELATPEEAVDVWPFVSTDEQGVPLSSQDATHLPHKQHIQALEMQSDDIMAQRERTSQQGDTVSKLQRPARLERFSSSATMTATQSTHQHDDMPDLATLTLKQDAPPSPPSVDIASWHDPRRTSHLTSSTNARIASPDSWRSLLPEHDPYFASDTLTSRSSSSYCSASSAVQADSPSRTRRNTFVTDYPASLSSANSSSSLASSHKPSYAADSWRSLLPETDRYHHASPDAISLPLPSVRHALASSAVDLTNPRLAFSALGPDVSDRSARDVAAKRHASFSVVEDASIAGSSSGSSTQRQMRDEWRVSPSSPHTPAEERDSWPCNRQPATITTATTTTTTPVRERLTSCSVSTPQSPCTLPFLDHRPAPVETNLTIETAPSRYTLVMSLPGFSLDCITLATKEHQHHRTLHIVADKWDTDTGGHFERRVTFPDKQCDLKNVKAEFDGTILRVYVPRTTTPLA